MILKNISVSFGEKTVIKNFSANITKQITCVAGVSGCGKTTLLKVIAGLIKNYSGEIDDLPRKPSIVFQEDRLLPWFTALKNVEAVIDGKGKSECAKYWLEKMQLKNEYDAYPNELSGGMKRRVALARALAYDGDFFILDEPFKGLDEHLKNTIMRIFTDTGKQIILSVHSPNELNCSCDFSVLNLNPEK